MVIHAASTQPDVLPQITRYAAGGVRRPGTPNRRRCGAPIGVPSIALRRSAAAHSVAARGATPPCAAARRVPPCLGPRKPNQGRRRRGRGGSRRLPVGAIQLQNRAANRRGRRGGNRRADAFDDEGKNRGRQEFDVRRDHRRRGRRVRVRVLPAFFFPRYTSCLVGGLVAFYAHGCTAPSWRERSLY